MKINWNKIFVWVVILLSLGVVLSVALVGWEKIMILFKTP